MQPQDEDIEVKIAEDRMWCRGKYANKRERRL